MPTDICCLRPIFLFSSYSISHHVVFLHCVKYGLVPILLFLQFPCIECGKTYTTEKILKSHKKIQHGKELPRYVCRVKNCKKTCTTPYNLKIHLKTIHNLEDELDKVKKCSKPLKKTKAGSSTRFRNQNLHSLI